MRRAITDPLDQHPLRLMWEYFSFAIPLGISYTFSESFLIIGALIGYLQKINPDKNYLGANTLLSVYAQVFFSLGVILTFPAQWITSTKIGEMRELLEQHHTGSPLSQSVAEVDYADHSSLHINVPSSPRPPTQMQIDEYKNYISNSLQANIALGLIAGIPVMLLMYFAKPVLEGVTSSSEELVRLAYQFLFPYLFGFPGFLGRMATEQMLVAFDRTMAAMWMAVFSLTIAVILAAVLCFKVGYGLAGIAYGFVAEHYLTWSLYSAYLKYHFGREAPRVQTIAVSISENKITQLLYSGYTFFSSHPSVNRSAQIKEFFREGWPMLLQFTAELGAWYVKNEILIAALGPEAVTAQNPGAQFAFLALIFVMSFGATTLQKVGTAMGSAKQAVEAIQKAAQDVDVNETGCLALHQQVSRLMRYGLFMGLLFISVVGAAVAIWPDGWIDAFTQHSEHVNREMARWLTRIEVMSMWCEMARYVMVSALRVTGDPNIPTFISVGFLSAGTVAALILGLILNHGVYAVSISYGIGVASGAVFVLKRFMNKLSSTELITVNATPKSSKSPSCLAKLTDCVHLMFCGERSSLESEDTPLRSSPPQVRKLIKEISLRSNLRI